MLLFKFGFKAGEVKFCLPFKGVYIALLNPTVDWVSDLIDHLIRYLIE